MVETPQDCCVSERTLEGIILIQVPIASTQVIGQYKLRRIVWLRTA